MKSLLVWVGVLAGSVAVGFGLYTLVVRPAAAANVSLTPAAEPSPAPTIYRYRTRVVKDPPKREVIDVPAPAPAPVAAPQQTYSPSTTNQNPGSQTGDDKGDRFDDSGKHGDQHDADDGSHSGNRTSDD